MTATAPTSYAQALYALGWSGLASFLVDPPPLTGDGPEDETPLWWGDTTLRDLEFVARIVRPAYRALLLAGYWPHRIVLDRPGAGAGHGPLSLDPEQGSVVEIGVGAVVAPPGASCGLVFELVPLRHHSLDSARLLDDATTRLAAAIEPSSRDWTMADDGQSAAAAVWTEETGGGARVWRWLRSGLDQLVDDVVAHFEGRCEAPDGRWGTGATAPAAGSGLVWLFDPRFWLPLDPSYPREVFAARPGQEHEHAGWAAGSLADFAVALEDDGGEGAWIWPAIVDHDVAAADAEPDRPLPASNDAHLDAAVAAAWTARNVAGASGHPVGEMLRRQLAGKDPLHKLLRRRRGLGPATAREEAERLAEEVSLVYTYEPDERAGQVVKASCWFDALLHLFDSGLIAPAALAPQGDLDVDAPTGDEVDREALEAVWRAPLGEEQPVVIDLELWGARVATLELVPAVCRVPFEDAVSWEYIPPSRREPLARVIVVAGPGVAVTPRSRDDAIVDVYRVQDYDLVPAWGERIDPELLTAPYLLSWPVDVDRFGTEVEDGLRPTGLLITHLPDGCRIEYPAPGQEGTEPSYRITLTLPANAHMARYAFSAGFMQRATHTLVADPVEGGLGYPYLCFLTIWKTPDVKLAVERPQRTLKLLGFVDVDVQDFTEWGLSHLMEVECWDFADPADIPLPGELLPTAMGEGWHVQVGPPNAANPDLPVLLRPAGAFYWPTDEPWSAGDAPASRPGMAEPVDVEALATGALGRFEYVLDLADIGVGLIPVVGEVADAGELALSLYTGTDRWGRPVTLFDQALMGVAVFVPFASKALLEEAGSAALDLGREATYAFRAEASNVLGEIWRAPPGLREERIADAAQSARGYSRALADTKDFIQSAVRSAVTRATARLVDAPLSPRDFVGRSGKGFWIPELNAAFKQWRARHAARLAAEGFTEEELPYVFMQRCRGRARTVLRLLAGHDLDNPFFWRDLRRRNRRRQLGRNWPSVDDPALPGVPRSAHVGKLDDVIALTGEHAPLVRRLLERISKHPPDLSPRGIDEETLGKVIGQQELSAEDFAARLAKACELAEDVAREASGGTIGIGDLLDLPGIEGFFQDVVTRGGKEHGSLFEIAGIAEEVAALSPAARRRLADYLRLQVRIDGKKGPDWLRYTGTGAGLLARIVQAKAYSSPLALFDPAARAEVVRQTLSDLARLAVDPDPARKFKLPGPDGSLVPIDSIMEYRINRDRLIQTAIENWKGTDDELYEFISDPAFGAKPGTPEWDELADQHADVFDQLEEMALAFSVQLNHALDARGWDTMIPLDQLDEPWRSMSLEEFGKLVADASGEGEAATRAAQQLLELQQLRYRTFFNLPADFDMSRFPFRVLVDYGDGVIDPDAFLDHADTLVDYVE